MIALYIILGIIALIIVLFSIRVTITAEYVDGIFVDVRYLFIKLRLLPEDPNKKKKKAKKEPETAPSPQVETSVGQDGQATTQTTGQQAQTEQQVAGQQAQQTIAQEAAKPDATVEVNTEAATQDVKNAADGVAEAAAQTASNAVKKRGFIGQLIDAEGLPGLVELISRSASIVTGGMKKIFRAFVIRELYLYVTVAGKDAASTAIKYGKTCAAVFPPLGQICSTMRVRKYDVDISPDFLANKGSNQLRAVISVRPILLTNAVIAMGVKLLVRLIKTKLNIDKINGKKSGGAKKRAGNSKCNTGKHNSDKTVKKAAKAGKKAAATQQTKTTEEEKTI